ncbi:hypothetical protein HRbin39_00961 [bacterium HR39]|nr:hypothetical protein HRbin39_00961 [bacterium HR39]
MRGPFPAWELREHAERHPADPAFLERSAGGAPLWAWELRDAGRLPEPVPHVEQRGQQGWVRLDSDGAADPGAGG